jgi:Collagen triple helix repeat (20 copies)
MLATLPDALFDALGRVVSDLRREWHTDVEMQRATQRAAIAEWQMRAAEVMAAWKLEHEAGMALLREAVARVKDGQDGAPGAEGPQGEQGPPGADGKDGVQGERGEKGEAGEPGPRGLQGEPGPSGVDGKDVDPRAIEMMISDMVADRMANLPPPEKGEKGDPGERGEKGDCGAVGPQGERGEPGMPGDRGEPGALGERGPMGEKGDPGVDGRDGKDAADIAGAFRTHDGKCIVTLTDGRVLDLGVIQGKDGAPGEPGRDGKDGQNGRDGLSIEDLSAEYDGQRTVTLRFARGEIVKDLQLYLPIPLDRGPYTDSRAYERGDVVSYAGQGWVARVDTDSGDRPDAQQSKWRLMVKAGRDGKAGKDGDKGDRGPQGPAGRDFVAGKV